MAFLYKKKKKRIQLGWITFCLYIHTYPQAKSNSWTQTLNQSFTINWIKRDSSNLFSCTNVNTKRFLQPVDFYLIQNENVTISVVSEIFLGIICSNNNIWKILVREMIFEVLNTIFISFSYVFYMIKFTINIERSRSTVRASQKSPQTTWHVPLTWPTS